MDRCEVFRDNEAILAFIQSLLEWLEDIVIATLFQGRSHHPSILLLNFHMSLVRDELGSLGLDGT